MKKMFFVFPLLLLVGLVNAQTLKSTMYTIKKSDFKTEIYNTDIVITPSQITIKNFTNGFTEDHIMKVDRIENKDYDGKMCVWYYCTDVKKDELSGTFYKDICIYDKSGKSLVFVSFADEVTEYWYKFYLK